MCYIFLQISTVWNEEDDNYYVHHDILMDSFPLALEWMDFDPDGGNSPGMHLFLSSNHFSDSETSDFTFCTMYTVTVQTRDSKWSLKIFILVDSRLYFFCLSTFVSISFIHWLSLKFIVTKVTLLLWEPWNPSSISGTWMWLTA